MGASSHARAAARMRLLAACCAWIATGCRRDAGANDAAMEAATADPANPYGICAPCHHASGLGVPNAYPSLVGTTWVVGDPELLIKVTLHGIQGPIMVNGRPWNAMMMPMGSVADAQLAAALTHVRTSWGNTASAVTAAQVAAVRTAHAGRTKPWTAGELGNPR